MEIFLILKIETPLTGVFFLKHKKSTRIMFSSFKLLHWMNMNLALPLEIQINLSFSVFLFEALLS